MDPPHELLILYVLIINLACLFVFGLDKHLAKSGRRRISEASLFLLSFVGGVFGGILGMLLFRHKTRKSGFKIVMGLIFMLHVGIGYWYLSEVLSIF